MRAAADFRGGERMLKLPPPVWALLHSDRGWGELSYRMATSAGLPLVWLGVVLIVLGIGLSVTAAILFAAMHEQDVAPSAVVGAFDAAVDEKHHPGRRLIFREDEETAAPNGASEWGRQTHCRRAEMGLDRAESDEPRRRLDGPHHRHPLRGHA